MEAQTSLPMTSGIYYLNGVMETASGFKLNADSTFEFFFSQGALDRYGEGTWSVNDGKVVLNGRKRPPHDFALLQSRKQPGGKITVQIADENEILLRYVYVIIKGGGKTQKVFTNEKGAAIFDPQEIDSIELIFEFCPEKRSIFLLQDKTLNYFVFRFEPWMMEMFLEDFSLRSDSTGLHGGHPILAGTSFFYRKHKGE